MIEYKGCESDIQKIPNTPGCYLLAGVLTGGLEINPGSLGHFALKPGFYFYFGSALGAGGLRARISRHVRLIKQNHWHFDYLRPHLRLAHAWFCDNRISECDLCQLIGGLREINYPIAKFGASDCRRKCPAHLIYANSCKTISSVEDTLSDLTPAIHGVAINENLLESSISLPGAKN